MTRPTDVTRKKIVKQHIQDGRTLASLVAEYGVSKASISNWVRAYCKECQTVSGVDLQVPALFMVLCKA